VQQASSEARPLRTAEDPKGELALSSSSSSSLPSSLTTRRLSHPADPTPSTTRRLSHSADPTPSTTRRLSHSADPTPSITRRLSHSADPTPLPAASLTPPIQLHPPPAASLTPPIQLHPPPAASLTPPFVPHPALFAHEHPVNNLRSMPDASSEARLLGTAEDPNSNRECTYGAMHTITLCYFWSSVRVAVEPMYKIRVTLLNKHTHHP
jgi:hypothetical protein